MRRVLSYFLSAGILCGMLSIPAAAAGPSPTDPNAPSLGVFLQREYLFDPAVKYTALSGGADHIAALREDGTLWTWGSNQYGQLGLGTDRAAYNAPISVLDDVKWARAGDNSTLAIKNDGSLWGFGKLDVYGGTRSPVRLADHAKAAAEGGGYFAVVTASGALEVYEDGVGSTPVTYAGSGVADAALCPGNSVYGKPESTGGILGDMRDWTSAGKNAVSYVAYAISDSGVLTRCFQAGGELHTETVAQNVTSLQATVGANHSRLYYLTADGTLYACMGSDSNEFAPKAVASGVRLFASHGMNHYEVKTDGTLWNEDKAPQMADGITAVAAVSQEGVFALKTDHTLSVIDAPGPRACLETAFGRMNAFPARFPSGDGEEPYDSKAMEIVGAATDDYEKARLICTWMDKNLNYDNSMQNHDGLELLNTGVGVCDAYSDLTVRLFEAAGIPCGTIIDYAGRNHSWNYALIDGAVVFIDNTNHFFDYPFTLEADNDSPSSFASGIGCSDWAAETVRAASSAGLIRYTSGQDLTAPITREQFAELAVQTVTALCGEDPSTAGGEAFSDTQNPRVLSAAAAGIVSGVGDGRFDPQAATNREQIAVMVDRAIDYIERQTGVNLAPDSGGLDGFRDRGEVSPWAAESVERLCANGVMSGTSAGTVAPKDACSVEQSILLLYRVYQRGQKK